MALVLLLLAFWTTVLSAASPADSAVFLAFKNTDPNLTQFVSMQRTGVTDELDLVIAMGTPQGLPMEQIIRASRWGGEVRLQIGLFLQEKTNPGQEKANPGRVWLLGTRAGFENCQSHVERVTATDSVISCEGEKSFVGQNQKWVYDVRSKRLLAQFSYQPFAIYRSFPVNGGAVFVGSDDQRLIAVEYKEAGQPAFRVLSGAEAIRWTSRVQIHGGIGRIFVESEKTPSPSVIPQLPRTTYDQFAAARPARVKDGFKREGTTIQDTIGPWQREGTKIWFGKNFYDGEGSTGVGGFGYFDTGEHKMRMFAPREIVDWSVSAMSVSDDAVWMALVLNTESDRLSGGVLRYDRQTEAVRRFVLLDKATRIVEVDGKILVATGFGFALIDGDQVQRYFVDRGTDGRLQVLAAIR